ncbi:hypothetical protein IEQ44_00055 [Nocardioides sp. Y6]|uniref:Fibronectin type-III domain-containing protein n=1 Tax=Nocardioides malaquae TaxID=2773426 RepID=A0ABR9RPF1_9ACTN|nr:GDSL-type esterase/lipase family protein [Nocardioides malaquae]MBE7323040.1 hypothetical protein [Nocardioides malaquae]
MLVVGDSITHASVGDYSWRYFAWRHLQASGARVDFVGPRQDPYVGEGSPWTPQYADPHFDQDHAAAWGDRISYLPMHDREALMTTYRPDVVVLALGTNDLGWMRVPPADVLAATRAWVEASRTDVPGLDVVLVEVPWTTHAPAMEYNALLGSLATHLDTPEERVTVARAAEGYTMGRDDDLPADTYDQVHPNTRGQVRIAAAVTDALAGLGVGLPYPRPLVFPAEGPRVVPVLEQHSGEQEGTLRWSVPPGATSFDVWMREHPAPWQRRARAHPAASYVVTGIEPCQAYDFRVLARKGWTVAGHDVASPVVRVRVGPKVTERPRPRLRAGARQVRLRWESVDGACQYRFRAVTRSQRGRVVTSKVVDRPRAVLRRVPADSVVRVRVRAEGARNAGPWSRTRVRRVRR